MKTIKQPPNDGRRVFLKKGTCSQTFFYLLNREFVHLKGDHEKAADLLAGGILTKGYQCGMLWGAALAVGAEAYRRAETIDQAIVMAIKGTQDVMDSFYTRSSTHDCRDITKCDWSSTASIAKYFLTGRIFSCFNMAQKWAPEAVEAAKKSMEVEPATIPPHVISCASEVAARMGASDEEIVMVAGFAGGLGLSGNGCGALSAAIFMNSLEEARQTGKVSFSSPGKNETYFSFKELVGEELLCDKISGKRFISIEDHTQFIQSGGCKEILDVLPRPSKA
jgi:hypothetical protein